MNKSNCCDNPRPVTEYSGTTERKFCGNCSTKKATTHEIEGWEKEFDKNYAGCQECGIPKTFIASLLTHQQERIIAALEGMQFADTSQAGQFSLHADGYNQALEEAIEVVKNLP